MMMRKNKKLYWSSFALQFALAVFAFFKIDNLAYANFVAYVLGLIWILCWLPVDSKHNNNKQLNHKMVCYIALVIMSLQISTIFFLNWKRLIDFFILLCFNFWLIVDDIIVKKGGRK